MMNLGERRAYLDRMRKNQQACLCPKCGKKTRHVTKPSKEASDVVEVVCEYCEEVCRKTTKDLIQPYIYVRIRTDGVVVPA